MNVPPPEPAARAALAAVIARDLVAIARIQVELRRLGTDATPAERAGVGYALHNLYCALENSFDQISRTFENHVVQVDRWHRELMSKMFLTIPGVRPAVLPEETRPLLDDLRSFRHRFRHGYDFHLDPLRLTAIVADWEKDGAPILAALTQFRDWLLNADL